MAFLLALGLCAGLNARATAPGVTTAPPEILIPTNNAIGVIDNHREAPSSLSTDSFRQRIAPMKSWKMYP